MKVAILGATGNVGTRLTSELLSRGHHVTAIARHTEKLATWDGVTAVACDVQDENCLAVTLVGHDALVHSLRFVDSDFERVVSATKKAKVPRLVVVGGAGSLEVSGHRLLDSPNFPAAYKSEAQAGADFLDRLRTENDLDWTYLSPSAVFAPGERTGRFRIGNDQLLVAADGKSHVSMEDFAIALVDELEQPKHSRQRFTVGY